MTFKPKYNGQRAHRMSLRVPGDIKNQIWAQAKAERISATDVVINILAKAFKGKPEAPPWKPGTTKKKGASSHGKDVFA